MTTVRTTPPPPAQAPSEASNRVTLSLYSRILARPEVGALVAAVIIFVFFLSAAPAFRSAESFFTILSPWNVHRSLWGRTTYRMVWMFVRPSERAAARWLAWTDSIPARNVSA